MVMRIVWKRVFAYVCVTSTLFRCAHFLLHSDVTLRFYLFDVYYMWYVDSDYSLFNMLGIVLCVV